MTRVSYRRGGGGGKNLSRRLSGVVLGSVLLAAGLLASAPSSGASAGAPLVGQCPSHLYSGVDAWSSDNGWVVGSRDPGCEGYSGLIQRWDGNAWRTVPSPQPGDPKSGEGTQLYDVAALSADDAWAVGEYYPQGSYQASLSLIEHWNGRRWTQVASDSPNQAGVNRFVTVDAISADDVWAIGYDCSPDVPAPAVAWSGTDMARGARPAMGGRPDGCPGLVEHFNGHRWRMVRPRLANMMQAVAGPSSNDLWAVGYTGTGASLVAVVRHFDGQRWRTMYKSTNDGSALFSVVWFSDDDVWATGYGFGGPRAVLHWDGTSWHRERMRGPGTISGAGLMSGSSPEDLWAIATNGEEPVLDHWDGTRWRSFPYPHRSHEASLEGLTAKYPGFTWAVGYTYGSASAQARSLLLRWTGTEWVNQSH